MKQLTVGIIGAGRIGKLHAENISRMRAMHLKAITDIYLDESWVKQLGIQHYGKEASLILEDDEIDAVLICTPAATHADLIISAAKANKHIFCEKPISLDVQEIKSAMQAVKDSGVKYQIGFNRRFDPNFVRIEEAVRKKKVGTPHLFHLTFRDPEPPPASYIAQSGGLFLDMTIHDFDMARFLSGDEIETVFAMGANRIGPEFAEYDDVDTAVIQLKFHSGALGVIDNSRKAAYGYDQRVEVFGSKGAISAENITPTRTQFSSSEHVCTDKPVYFFLDRYQDSYINEICHFRDVILQDKPSLTTEKDVLMPVIIGLAAKRSLKENKPIKIFDEVGIQ